MKSRFVDGKEVHDRVSVNASGKQTWIPYDGVKVRTRNGVETRYWDGRTGLQLPTVQPGLGRLIGENRKWFLQIIGDDANDTEQWFRTKSGKLVYGFPRKRGGKSGIEDRNSSKQTFFDAVNADLGRGK